ncbi:effector-associated constant component EACC1 [Streptomyces sp. CA-111067]|uniref:effector-associated constant component EACC1 n=1 Tax=Streptomyces sp. CA-111067 TaxID=3240046 RepID=UPI003D95212C
MRDAVLQVTLKIIDFGAEKPGAKNTELALLRRQLNLEPELRGCVTSVPKAPTETQMGTGIELLAVALGSSGAVSALVRTLPALLKARRSAATVELSLPDGRNVKITADSADDARSLLDAALRDQRQP